MSATSEIVGSWSKFSMHGFVALVVTLWTVDVLVNLAMGERILTDTVLLSRPFDFLGLLLRLSQASLVLLLLTVSTSLLIVLPPIGTDPDRERVPLLSAHAAVGKLVRVERQVAMQVACRITLRPGIQPAAKIGPCRGKLGVAHPGNLPRDHNRCR